jgi:Periplasmic binding protein
MGVALVAGCGSSSGSGSGSTSSGAHTPYKVMYISDLSNLGGLFTPYETSLMSVVKAANARGGADGHPIDVIVCDSQANANADAACGQQAVSDKVIAVISYDLEGTEFPYLQAADIPDFNFGIGAAPLKSPVSFMIDDSVLDASFGPVGALAQDGCKNFAAIGPLLGSGAQIAQTAAAFGQAATKYHISYLGLISVPQTAPDTSSYVAEMVHKGATCVDDSLMGTQSVNGLSAMATYPSITRIALSADYLHQVGVGTAITPVANKLGSRLVAVLPAEQPTAASTNPKVKQWVADEQSYTHGKNYLMGSVDSIQWAEVQLMIQAADHTGPDPTGPKMVKYLNTVSDFNPGVVPPVNFTKPVPNIFGPRVFTAWVASGTFSPPYTVTRTTPFLDLLTGQTNNNTQ